MYFALHFKKTCVCRSRKCLKHWTFSATAHCIPHCVLLASYLAGKRERRLVVGEEKPMSKYNYDLSVDGVSVEAILNKLGGVAGAKRFLRDELNLVEVKPQFERNEHGHIIISITGLALTGEQEIERLNSAGFRISRWTKSCFTSTKKDGYDKCHRLEDGHEYQLVIIPGKEVAQNRTTTALREYAAGFGYQQALAGVVPRIREAVSDEMMEKMGFWYIAALHDPITDSVAYPRVLHAYRLGDGQWVDAGFGYPGLQWRDNGAFAFLVSAS